MAEPTFPYPNGYRVTYDVGNGLEYADSAAWSGVTATISPFKTGASSPLVYVKITQYGSPTLPTLMNELLHDCRNLVEVEFENLDTSKVTNINYLFSNNYALTTIKGLETWDVSKVATAQYTWRNCYALTSLDLSTWVLPLLTNANYMCVTCTGLEWVDLSGWSTPNLINIQQAFDGDLNLVTIYAGDGWTVANVTNGGQMFRNCTKLVGAVAYNASQTGVAMANYTTGYLTYKAPPAPQTNIPVFMAHYARLRNA